MSLVVKLTGRQDDGKDNRWLDDLQAVWALHAALDVLRLGLAPERLCRDLNVEIGRRTTAMLMGLEAAHENKSSAQGVEVRVVQQRS